MASRAKVKRAKIGDGYTCGMCLCSFVPRRSDAQYCSDARRVAAHRARKVWLSYFAEGQAPEQY